MDNYTLVLDTYEGSGELDEAEFLAGGVAGRIIRLNDTKVFLHKDEQFDIEWARTSAFIRAPYYVYSPWESAQTNLNWLGANIPDCPCIFIDTELSKSGVSPSFYGSEYNKFIALCQERWKTIIYTGGWFLSQLTPWPRIDYWWSAWPNIMYPLFRVKLTWKQLREKLAILQWPLFNADKCPGTIRLGQVSGDRLILPGTTRAIDVSVFPGTAEEYRAWLGYSGVGGGVSPTQPPVFPEYIVIPARVNVRSGPSSTSAWMGYAVAGEVYRVTEKVNGYSHLENGNWIYSGFLKLK